MRNIGEPVKNSRRQQRDIKNSRISKQRRVQLTI
jgi:hypothetical protein